PTIFLIFRRIFPSRCQRNPEKKTYAFQLPAPDLCSLSTLHRFMLSLIISQAFPVTPASLNYAEMQKGVIQVHVRSLQVFRRVLPREMDVLILEMLSISTPLRAFQEKCSPPRNLLADLDVDYYDLDQGK
ncbi:hypothetical protein GYMLUDRAFT_667953, partial [Collybiopsis luxurians FD-317 M1]